MRKTLLGFIGVTALLVVGSQALRWHYIDSPVSPDERQSLRDAPNDTNELSGQLPENLTKDLKKFKKAFQQIERPAAVSDRINGSTGSDVKKCQIDIETGFISFEINTYTSKQIWNKIVDQLASRGYTAVQGFDHSNSLKQGSGEWCDSTGPYEVCHKTQYTLFSHYTGESSNVCAGNPTYSRAPFFENCTLEFVLDEYGSGGHKLKRSAREYSFTLHPAWRDRQKEKDNKLTTLISEYINSLPDCGKAK